MAQDDMLGPPSYPPEGVWDERMLRGNVCPMLQPARKIHGNTWFTVYERGGYYTMEPNHSEVIILPTVEEREIVMVRVKRPVLQDTPLELPAGGFDPEEEEPARGAARELAEETGIHIEDLTRFTPLPPLSTSPNRIPYPAYTFHIDITEEEFARRALHDEEIASVERISLSRVSKMVVNGDIYVSTPMALVTAYILKRQSAAMESLSS